MCIFIQSTRVTLHEYYRFYLALTKWEDTRFFISYAFLAEAQMLLSEIKNSLKLALPFLTKRCLKFYLGGEQSFDKCFGVQFSIFSEIGFENWQISA